MAKPKTEVIVNIDVKSSMGNESLLSVWCENHADEIDRIAAIEGVTDVIYRVGKPNLLVLTSPRYDPQEIADEIKELLTVEVPEVFKEE